MVAEDLRAQLWAIHEAEQRAHSRARIELVMCAAGAAIIALGWMWLEISGTGSSSQESRWVAAACLLAMVGGGAKASVQRREASQALRELERHLITRDNRIVALQVGEQDESRLPALPCVTAEGQQ